MTQNCSINKCSKHLLLVITLCFSQAIKTSADFQKLLDDLYFKASTTKTELSKVKIIKSAIPKNLTKKKITLTIYMSAVNDLDRFAIRNIKQIAEWGSTLDINIVVQLDIRKSGNEKITRRYYIQKGKILHLNADDPDSQKMDSGDPETLISFCDWTIKNFPAEQYALVLWNHGSGILDPERCRTLRPEEFITFNPATQRLELERSIGYIERMLQRGICWDDVTGNYLNNQKLDYALNEICTKLLDGEKFLFIGFDACLMQMIEVANIVKKYAHIMIGSQEAELGYGWNYADILKPFQEKTLEPVDFAEHIVECFGNFYEKITNEYTLSAINLDSIDYMEENINDVAMLLIKGLHNQKNNTVKKTIRASRNKIVCTHFDEPSYIDIHHFYGNMMANIEYIKLNNKTTEKEFKKTLYEELYEGRRLIEHLAFANTAGKDLKKARGLSIFFPQNGIHSSYGKTLFAQENKWIDFLTLYLSM